MEPIKYSYAKLMEDNKLTLAELPEDVRIAIKDIGRAERGIAMAENKGRNVSGAQSKLKALDKWATRDIQDYIEGKKTNTTPAPTADDIINSIKDDPKKDDLKKDDKPADDTQKPDEPKPDPKGVAIETELKKMHESGKKEWELEAVKGIAPKAYDDIFETYKEGSENGVATSYYSLVETSPKIFTINKI